MKTLWDLMGRDKKLVDALNAMLHFMQSERVRQTCLEVEKNLIKNGRLSDKPATKLYEDVTKYLRANGLFFDDRMVAKKAAASEKVIKNVEGATSSNSVKISGENPKTTPGLSKDPKDIQDMETSGSQKIARPKSAIGTKEGARKNLLVKFKNRMKSKTKDKKAKESPDRNVGTPFPGNQFDLDDYLKEFKKCNTEDSSTDSSSSSSKSRNNNDKNNGNIRQNKQQHPVSLQERKAYAKLLLGNLKEEAKDTDVMFKGQGQDTENMISYQKFVKENRQSYGQAPKFAQNTRIRRTLMEGSYPNWTVADEDRLPKILRYTWKGKVKKLGKYLEEPKKKFDINTIDSRGRTALHMAASWGCLRTLKMLLSVPGIKLDERDEHGKTPLFKAVEIGSLECVKALIGAGANSRIWARDSRDPLTYVLEFHGDEYFKIFKYLWDYTLRTGDQVEPGKLTLLHKAVLNNKSVVNLKCVNHMLLNEVDISARDGDGRTAAHMCSILDRDDLLQLLIAHEVNPFHYDLNAKTPIDYATPDSKVADLYEEYLELGPGQVEDALLLKDGSTKESKKAAEDYRERYFGFVPQ